jgi:hypothetical protein
MYDSIFGIALKSRQLLTGGEGPEDNRKPANRNPAVASDDRRTATLVVWLKHRVPASTWRDPKRDNGEAKSELRELRLLQWL